ncbi:MAG: SDR family oxidoreductase [Candidatus Omnitrophica bacterium]|nr:SDR family oxidoreductase [Candidatus Omnitrophota bacterium]
MINKKNILLTGATGFLGKYLLKLFLLDKGINVVYLLIRGSNQETSIARAQKVLKTISCASSLREKKVIVVSGDISKKKLGLTGSEYGELCKKINSIYHSAALTGFSIDSKMAKMANVFGTKNLLDFCSDCLNLSKFNYIGTAFIAGNKVGSFSEDDFDCGQKFNNHYEQSKFEAESIVRKNFKNEKFFISIFRPSIILGDFCTGGTTNFKMFYEPLYLFSKGIFNSVPANVRCSQNIVPVDLVAKGIFLLAESEKKNAVYHVVNPTNVRAGDFVDLAARFFGYTNPEFIPIEKFNMKELTPVQYKLIQPFLSYFNYKATFLSDKTQKALKDYKFEYPKIDNDYYLRLFNYCANVGFIKKVK